MSTGFTAHNPVKNKVSYIVTIEDSNFDIKGEEYPLITDSKGRKVNLQDKLSVCCSSFDNVLGCRGDIYNDSDNSNSPRAPYRFKDKSSRVSLKDKQSKSTKLRELASGNVSSAYQENSSVSSSEQNFLVTESNVRTEKLLNNNIMVDKKRSLNKKFYTCDLSDKPNVENIKWKANDEMQDKNRPNSPLNIHQSKRYHTLKSKSVGESYTSYESIKNIDKKNYNLIEKDQVLGKSNLTSCTKGAYQNFIILKSTENMSNSDDTYFSRSSQDDRAENDYIKKHKIYSKIKKL